MSKKRDTPGGEWAVDVDLRSPPDEPVRAVIEDWDWDEDLIAAIVEVDALPGWRLDVEVAGFMHGTAVLRSVRVSGGETVTTRVLAAIPTGAALRAVASAAAQLPAQLSSAGMQTSPALWDEVGRWAAEAKAEPRPGRRGRPDRFYADLAVDYERMAAVSESPTKDLAEKHGLSYARMKNLLSEAVSRGLLIRSGKGRAGGRATDTAKEILDGPR